MLIILLAAGIGFYVAGIVGALAGVGAVTVLAILAGGVAGDSGGGGEPMPSRRCPECSSWYRYYCTACWATRRR